MDNPSGHGPPRRERPEYSRRGFKMAGITVHRKDRAGGVQDKEVNTWFRIGGEPVVTVGDTVAPHGDPPHAPAPKMVEGTSWFRINGRPVCHAGHKVDCGHATTGRYWFQIYEKGERQFILSAGDPCNVEHIPAIMRAQDPPWNEGAMLLERWLDGKASTDREAVPPETKIISMDYVLSFMYARSKFDRSLDPNDNALDTESRSIRSLFWFDDSTKRAIGNKLNENHLLRDVPTQFNFIDLPPNELRSGAVHNQPVSIAGEKRYDATFPNMDTIRLNSIDASLGSYAFYYNVAGSVQPLPDGKHEIRIDEVGIYVHDSFDFEGFQYLGHWDVDTNSVSIGLASYIGSLDQQDIESPLTSGCKITNAKFRSWREATGHGQDFYIVTDVMRFPTVGESFTFSYP
jgi:uncharacterized Zn-binding protein involved in type VI secretion